MRRYLYAFKNDEVNTTSKIAEVFCGVFSFKLLSSGNLSVSSGCWRYVYSRWVFKGKLKHCNARWETMWTSRVQSISPGWLGEVGLFIFFCFISFFFSEFKARSSCVGYCTSICTWVFRKSYTCNLVASCYQRCIGCTTVSEIS